MVNVVKGSLLSQNHALLSIPWYFLVPKPNQTFEFPEPNLAF